MKYSIVFSLAVMVFSCVMGVGSASPPAAVVAESDDVEALSIFDITVASPTPIQVVLPAMSTAIAITPNAHEAWTCMGGLNSVAVVDLTTNTLISTIAIPVGFNPVDIAITPDGTQAWVCNESVASITVINTANKTVSATITGPFNSPDAVAITPDGKHALVCNLATAQVYVIDVATHAASVAINVGSHPDAIAVTPDGKQAWVCNLSDSTVSVIDLSTYAVSATIGVGTSPNALAIAPDNTQVWVSNNGSQTLSVIDIASKTVIGTISLGASLSPEGIAMTPNNTTAWEANGVVTSVANVQAYSRSSQSLTRTVSYPSGVQLLSIAITPDQAPTAQFTASINRGVGAFDASASSSPYGTIASYRWNFGDGTPVQTVTTPQISHTYASGGTFTVTLTVTNSQGTSTTQTFTGQTVSNNGGPSAQTSQQIVIPKSPSKFKGKPKFYHHHKKLFLKTWWTPSHSSNIMSYIIAGYNKTRATIPVKHKRSYKLRLHPHFPHHSLSKKYKRYLQHKYTIQAVNGSGASGPGTRLHVDQ